MQAYLALFAFACVPEQDSGCMTDLKQNSDSSGRGNSFALVMLSFLSFVVWGSRFKCVAAAFSVRSNISNLMACFVAGVNLQSPFVQYSTKPLLLLAVKRRLLYFEHMPAMQQQGDRRRVPPLQ
jgi:hypothetical protein